MPCYNDWEYKTYGNHGNSEYEYEHELYSDHYKPDHCGFEDSGYNNAEHKDSPEGFKYGHREPKDNRYGSMGPGYKDDGERTHGEGGYKGEAEEYEHEEIEDEGDTIDKTHERGELIDKDYKRCELEELERMANQRGHTAKHHNSGTQRTNKYGHNKDNDMHTATRICVVHTHT
jgi:hypothetical protein